MMNKYTPKKQESQHPKLALATALLCILSLLLTTSCSSPFTRSKGFCIDKITSNHRPNAMWEAPFPEEDKSWLLNEVLGQEYTYLGSGKQCYAFESCDHKYVIKFFKQKHMDFSRLRDRVPLASRRAKRKKKRELREKTYQSYLLAYKALKEETGLIYLHLTKSDTLHKTLRIQDIQGNTHKLALDQMEFLIQQKAKPIFPTFKTLIKTGQLTKAKARIDAILTLIETRCAKGIIDDDVNCEKNLGFYGDRAIEIDTGEFSMGYIAPTYKLEARRAVRDLLGFLTEESPELALYLQDRLK